MASKTTIDKTILLLRHTESRNSMYKMFIGALKIITTILTRQLKEGVAAGRTLEVQRKEHHLHRYDTLSTSIHNARSLIRIGEFVPDLYKLHSLTVLVRALGPENTEWKKFIEFFRVLLHAVFIVSDNLLFLIRNYIITNISTTQQQRLSRIAMRSLYYHYVVSFLFFLVELRDGIRRWEYDHPAAVRATINALLALLRDGSDALAVCPSLPLSDYYRGVLWLISGTAHNYLLWRQIK